MSGYRYVNTINAIADNGRAWKYVLAGMPQRAVCG